MPLHTEPRQICRRPRGLPESARDCDPWLSTPAINADVNRTPKGPDHQMFRLAQVPKDCRCRIVSAIAFALPMFGCGVATDANAGPKPLPSVDDKAISLVIAQPRRKPSFSWDYTSVFFVTNRKINEDAASSSGMFDDYYTNDSDIAVSFGQACIAFPTNRRPAEQDYTEESDIEEPARFFTIKGFVPITSVQDFESDLSSGGDPSFTHFCPSIRFGSIRNPILYFHGYATPFTAAITRGAQLKLDLDRETMIVVTWPSDKPWRYGGYEAAEKEEEKAIDLVPLVTSLTDRTSGHPPSIIAHSLGARLLVDGVRSMARMSHTTARNKFTTILAAPDIDSELFVQQYSLFKVLNRSTTVYCGQDRALKDIWHSSLGSQIRILQRPKRNFTHPRGNSPGDRKIQRYLATFIFSKYTRDDLRYEVCA